MLLYPHNSLHKDMKHNYRLKRRSLSAEDLQNYVKRILHGSYDDAEIFDKWNCKEENVAKDAEKREDETQSLDRKILNDSLMVIDADKKSMESKKSLCDAKENIPMEKSGGSIDCAKNFQVFDQVESNENENESQESDEISKGPENIVNEVLKNVVSEALGRDKNTINEPGGIVRRVKVRKKIRKIEHQKPEKDEPKCLEERINNDLTFEAWKKRKNMFYKEFLKKERTKRRLQLEVEQQEIERKRIAHETQLRSRKQGNNYKKSLVKKQIELNKQAYNEACKMQAEAKKIINEQAFKTWKKKKDMELRQRRMMIYPNNYSKESPKSGINHTKGFMPGIGSQFDYWLNQLDGVLHYKYLRERRHRVRSFYCQPAYYGTAAMHIG